MRKFTKLWAVLLVLTLLLCGCKGPAPSTDPTQPQASTPADTEPVATDPQPTEPAPTDGEEPEGELFSVTREGHYVYEEPNYDSDWVQGLPAGVYTIMQTEQDAEGNTWGKLKSGMGWICMTEIELAKEAALPVAIVEAYDELLKGDDEDYFELFPDESCYKIAVFAYEKLTDVKLSLIDVFAEEPNSDEVKWEQESLTPECPVVLEMAFPGDFTTYELTFVDASGAARAFRIIQSGRNSMILITEEK